VILSAKNTPDMEGGLQKLSLEEKRKTTYSRNEATPFDVFIISDSRPLDNKGSACSGAEMPQPATENGGWPPANQPEDKEENEPTKRIIIRTTLFLTTIFNEIQSLKKRGVSACC
jgi:hypothetical protein